jgi:hypothetical protein
MVARVWRLVDSPPLRRMVTGPLASDHVIFSATPALTLWNQAGPMVNWAALAKASTAEVITTLENRIFEVFEVVS